jgi:hypothetical protein
MEKVEFPRSPGDATPADEETAGGTVSARWPRPEPQPLEARATRWWAAYGGSAVSNR